MEFVKSVVGGFPSVSLLGVLLYAWQTFEVPIATSDHVRYGVDLIFSELFDVDALFLDLDRLLNTLALLASDVIGDFTVGIKVPVVHEARSLVLIQKVFGEEESHPIVVGFLLESQGPNVVSRLDEALVPFVRQEFSGLLLVFALGCIFHSGRVSLAFWITEKQELVREQMRQEVYEAVEVVSPGQDVLTVSGRTGVRIVTIEVACMAELGVALASCLVNPQVPCGDAEIDELKFDGIHGFLGFFHVVHLFIGVVLAEADVVGFEIVVNIANWM